MLETENMSLGQRLAALRKRQDWTQDEAAKRIGIHGRHLSRLETDKLAPSPKTLRRIAEVYAVSMNDLLQGEEKPASLDDPRLLRTFQQAQKLGEEEKKVVMCIVQALLTKRKMELALSDDD